MGAIRLWLWVNVLSEWMDEKGTSRKWLIMPSGDPKNKFIIELREKDLSYIEVCDWDDITNDKVMEITLRAMIQALRFDNMRITLTLENDELRKQNERLNELLREKNDYKN
jgi:hypothetical protein